MANFPTSPTTGDTFHSGSNLYSWTGTAWKIVAGDRPDYGVVTFESEVITTEGVLSLHFDNNLTDTGSSGATITHPGSNNGAPVYVTPGKFSSPALHLDSVGSGNDFIVLPASTDMQWDGDFTIDFWMKWGSASATLNNWVSIISPDVSTSATGPGIDIWWSGTTRSSYAREFGVSIAKAGSGYTYGFFQYWSSSGVSGNPAHVDDSTLTTQFHHIAICRTSNIVEMWLNGKKLTVGQLVNSTSGTELESSATVNSANTEHYIGRSQYWSNVADDTSTDVHDLNSYVDEFRIVKGSAEFSGSTFTPPVKAHGPSVTAIAGKSQIYAKDVVGVGDLGDALYRFDDDYVDTKRSPNNPAVPTTAAGGTVAFETSDMAGTFGKHLTITNSSNTGGNYLTVPDPGWGTGAFTIEAFINPGSDGIWFGIDATSGPGGSYTWYIKAEVYAWGPPVQYILYLKDSFNYNTIGSSGYAVAGTMAHYAVVANGSGNFRVYRNGLYMGSRSQHSSRITNFTGEDLLIGRHGNSSGQYAAVLDMNIDELKITLSDPGWGTSTSSVNFTVPTAPFTAPSTTTELYMMDGSGTETKLT